MSEDACCYLEVLYDGKWKWMGTFYDKSIIAAAKQAAEHGEFCMNPKVKWRVTQGEPL